MAIDNAMLAAAEQIRDASSIGENTAARVGGLLVDIVTAIGALPTGADIVANFAAISASTHVVDFKNSPVLYLDSMGAALDGDGGFTPSAGDIWWSPTEPAKIKYYEDGSQTFMATTPDRIYINKQTGNIYRYLFDSNEMVQISSSGGGSNVYIDKSDPNYVDIIIDDNTPRITVSTASITMSGDNKTATFKVSGRHLTGGLTISKNNAYFTVSPNSLTPTDGELAETTVTVTFSGSTDQEDDLTVSGGGATAQTVHVEYSAVPVPTITAGEDSLSFTAAGGETDSATVAVSGINLEGNITAAITGADASKFQVIGSPITQSGGIASGNLTVIYSPAAGDDGPHEANLVLSSTNASPVTIPLAGAIAGTLSISPASANIGIPSEGSGTATFNVTGANLTPGSTASVAVSGTGMTVNKNSLTVGLDGTISDTVTVTFSGSADSTGQLTIHHNDVATDATASVVGAIVTPLAVGTEFRVGNLLYKVLSGQATVSVKQVSYTVPSGAVRIPATVSDLNSTAADGTTPIADAQGATYAVTELAANAFNSNSSITSLIIPEGVTKIGQTAFYGNASNKLANISIPVSVTNIVAASGSVNDGPRNMLVIAEGSTVTIGLNTFWSNSLDKVVIRTAYTSGMSLSDFPTLNKSTSLVGSFLQKSNGGEYGNGNVNTALYVPDQDTKTFLENSGDAAYNNFAGGIHLISELDADDLAFINSI